MTDATNYTNTYYFHNAKNVVVMKQTPVVETIRKCICINKCTYMYCDIVNHLLWIYNNIKNTKFCNGNLDFNECKYTSRIKFLFLLYLTHRQRSFSFKRELLYSTATSLSCSFDMSTIFNDTFLFVFAMVLNYSSW